jgi:hypothetical protein
MSDSSRRKHAISRLKVGIIALVLLMIWGVMGLLQWTGTLDSGDSQVRVWWAGFGRVGLLMIALWVALPSKDRPAAWANISKPMLIVVLLVAVMVAIRPWIGIPLLALMAVVGFFLRPRTRRRPESRAG